MRLPGYALVAAGAQKTAEEFYPKLSVKKYLAAECVHTLEHLTAASRKVRENREFDAKQAKKNKTADEQYTPRNPVRTHGNSGRLPISTSTSGSTDPQPSSPVPNFFDHNPISQVNEDTLRSRSPSVASDDSYDSDDSDDSDDSVGSDASSNFDFYETQEPPEEPLNTAAEVADITQGLEKYATETNIPAKIGADIAQALQKKA